MKILVISLLRLGDIILLTPTLRGLRRQYPNATIHVLINSQFANVRNMMPYVDDVILFDRNALQKGLGEAERSLFESHGRLENLIESLNTENYNLSFNFTHTRLSGWLMSLINAKTKHGLVFDDAGQAGYGSPWFEYLNSQADDDGEQVFHYADVFQFAAHLNLISPFIRLAETKDGREEALLLSRGRKEFVVFQAFTSDVKKDWGLERWHELARLFAATHSGVPILFLAAPNEYERLNPFVQDLRTDGIDAEVAVCSLEGALSLLQGAKALVTGDTSIKHLACATQVPIIELSLGSSDFHRTGVYKSGDWIVQSKETCAPCVHSKACHRSAHFCAQRIAPELISLILNQIYSGNTHQIRLIAEEYKDEADILRTEIWGSGFWAAYSVSETFSEANVSRWLDRSGRKLYLKGRAQNLDWVEQVGGESEKLTRLLRKVYPDTSASEWRDLLSELERQVLSIETRLISFQTGVRSLHSGYQDPGQMKTFVKNLIAFREKLKSSSLMRPQRNSLDALIEDDITPAFVRFRRIVDAINEIEGRVQIELKLIRTLQNQLEISP